MEEEKGKEPEERPNGDDLNDLKLIRRRLYARKEPVEIEQRRQELHRLGVTRESKELSDEAGTVSGAKYKNLALIRAKRVGRVLRFSGLLTLILVLIVVAVAATLWYRSTQTVTSAQVSLMIEAPREFTAGEEMIYVMDFHQTLRRQ